MRRFTQLTKLVDIIRERATDIQEYTMLRTGKLDGRRVTETRAVPTAETDVVEGDAEGDELTDANYVYILRDKAGTLAWERTDNNWATGSSGTSPLTTKGDIYTYDSVDARLPVGTDGQTLKANSSTSTGLEWTSPAGVIDNTTRVTNTYTILTTDHVIFCNTDGGSFTATLPAGVEGQTFRIINSGTSGGLLTIAPDGAEHLIGVNSSFSFNDGEVLELTYNSTDGWY